jgi:hypothetical protein
MRHQGFSFSMQSPNHETPKSRNQLLMGGILDGEVATVLQHHQLGRDAAQSIEQNPGD